MLKSRLTGYLMILASAVCFSSYGVWAKLIGDSFGVYSQAWIRSAIILLILIPVGMATNAFRRVDRRDWRLFIPILFFTVFTVTPIFYSFNHMTIATATLLFYGVFLLTTYIAGWVMGEKVTAVKLLAFALAIVGLVMTFGLSVEVFSLLAAVLAIANGIASGGEVSFSKLVTEKYSTIQVTSMSWAAILVTHFAMAYVTGEQPPAIGFNQQWIALVVFALVASVGFWLVIEGFKHVDASLGGLIGLSEVVISIGFGLVFFDQRLTLSIVLGAILILLAGMIPDLAALRSRTKPTPLPNAVKS